MQKSAILIGNSMSYNDFYIPGFVQIAAARAADDDGRTEFHVVYDDQELDIVSQVLVSPSLEPATVPAISLGLAGRHHESSFFLSYTATTVFTPNSSCSMTFHSRGYQSEFVVSGFLGIDRVEPVGGFDNYDLVVRYDPAETEVSKLTVIVNGPHREMYSGDVDLGIIYLQGLPKYVRYNQQIVTP
ncbi:hypothetical protein ACWEKT_03200 [Nocardia takedensis]